MPIELTEEIKGKLREKYPEASFKVIVQPLPGGDGEQRFVVKLPISDALWQMVREKGFSKDPAVQASANRTIFNGAVVWPAEAELKELLRAYPALPDAVGGEIGELAGHLAGARQEKF